MADKRKRRVIKVAYRTDNPAEVVDYLAVLAGAVKQAKEKGGK